jgi:hypothetical protein
MSAHPAAAGCHIDVTASHSLTGSAPTARIGESPPTQARQYFQNARVRTVAAMTLLLAFWVAAYLAAVVAIVPQLDIDDPRNSAGMWVGRAATVVAVVLWFASGPVSYVVGRRRLFLAAPLLFAAVAAVIVAMG